MTESIVIWEKFPFRILETIDSSYSIKDLKGDMFKPELIADMGYAGTVKDLARDEMDFNAEVDRQGVYGYELQLWNPFQKEKWAHVDSCWGFVGQYVADKKHKYNHYIVDEMKETAKCLKQKIK